MSELYDYVVKNSITHANIEKSEVDLVFFGITKGPEANAKDLKELILAHKGAHNNVNVFDGKEHGYIELGGWIGDQGAALAMIGLGSTLGLWRLLTPKTELGDLISDELAKTIAGAGMISLIVES